MALELRLQELRLLYRDVASKSLPDGRTIVRIKGAPLPQGATQMYVDFLLVFSPGQDIPIGRFVRDQIRLPGGNLPAYSPTLIDGETWYGFSYNFQWNPANPIYQYVESALHRFVKAN